MATNDCPPDAVRVGVLGTGYMGRNHARILSDLPGAELVGVFDKDSGRAAEVAAEFGTRAFEDAASLVEASRALVVAVPTNEHHAYVLDALNAGRDILVEKPIAESLEQADELCGVARDKGLILQVGHVERFNPVCMELPRLMKTPSTSRASA